jgi:hypothetical protein
MTSFTVGRMRMVWGMLAGNLAGKPMSVTHMLKLGRVGALLIHQRWIRLDDAVCDEVV